MMREAIFFEDWLEEKLDEGLEQGTRQARITLAVWRSAAGFARSAWAARWRAIRIANEQSADRARPGDLLRRNSPPRQFTFQSQII